MIVHMRGAETTLDPVPDDEGHWGEATSSYGTLYASGDEALQLGLWEFRGEQHTTQQDGYEEVVVVLEGSVEIECDGETYRLEAGDVIVYDCPIGGKRLRCAEGFRAAYVVRYRGEAPAA
jgi:uncharacterized cupin superfamily protein